MEKVPRIPPDPDLEDALGLAFRYGPEALIVLDGSNRIAAFNPAAEKLTGRSGREVLGRPACRCVFRCPQEGGPETFCKLAAALRASPGTAVETLWEGRDGRVRYAELTASALPDEFLPGAALVVMRDATRHLKQRRQLEELAHTDALTGLGNRYRLQEARHRLIAASGGGRAGGGHVAATVAMLDVDNMKQINDGLGHHIGDKVLQEIGGLLQRHTRQSDVAVRYGGDEFVLVLPRTSLTQAQRMMRRLEKLMNGLSRFLDIPLPVSVSYGLAEVEPGEALEEALVRADKAMYRRKIRRRSRSGARQGGAVAPDSDHFIY